MVFINLSLQEGVLSPVQDGDNKPQIDSNKANNYKIVKEVKSESFFSSYFLFILSGMSIMHLSVAFRSYFDSVSCAIPVRRVVCSSRDC